MLSIIIILGTAIVLCAIFINPKLGTYIIWPILFMYPHRWFFEHQFLPLNIGVDDLFCITLFLVVLLRRNLLGGVPIRFGYAFGVISSFVIIVIIANIASYGEIKSALVRTDCIKDILKLGVYWGLFYAILHCIDNIHDLRIQFSMFSMAIVGGAAIVILQYFFPYKMEIFISPKFQSGISDELTRTSGAFLNANSAACMLGCSLMLVIAAVRLQKNILYKVFIYSFIFILLMGILLTKSRSGLFSIGVTTLLMGILGRNKKITWFIIIAALVVSIGFAGFREAFTRRIQRTSDIRQDSSVVGRIQTWKDYFNSATAKTYMFGQGVNRAREIHGKGESHSSYVSLIVLYGIGGVIWALISLIIFFKKGLSLRESPEPLVPIISTGCIWALVNWGFYSIMADALNAPHPRFLLFYLVVLMDRTSAITKQELALLPYEEQIDSLQMQYAGEEIY